MRTTPLIVKTAAIEKEAAVWEACSALFDRGRSLDKIHARISLDYGWRLLAVLGGDRNVVIPAIMLHDIGNVMISDGNLEKKTINPGTAGSEKEYSIALKLMHLREGETLSKKILQQIGYPKALIDPIAEIVGDHENSRGGPPEDLDNPNKVIVSDADKLYRYSANGFLWMCRIHNIPKQEMLRLNFAKIEQWLITDAAKQIAWEELRKTPGSQRMEELMALRY